LTGKKRFWSRFKSEPAKPTKNIKKAGNVVDKIIRYAKWLVSDED